MTAQKKANSILINWLLLVCFGNYANAQTDICQLTTYFVDHAAKAGSSRFNIGYFCLTADADEPTIMKSFLHEETGTQIKVSVDFAKEIFGKKMLRMKLAMTLNDSEEDALYSINRAEAEAIRDRNWHYLAVSKSLKIGNRDYTYTLGCGKKVKTKSTFFKCRT
jgi:hypothetical protein